MFDQSTIHPDRRTLPLRPFQKAILAATTQYNFVNVYAPSQSGKSTAATVLAATLMYEFPGIPILILSTREEQAARLLEDIRENYLTKHRVPELRKLDPKGGDSSTTLKLLYSQSKIIALPHSMKALTGNPAQFIILDEMARWDKDDPQTIYAEAVARMGDKRNFMLLNISTFHGESIIDPTSPTGYRGNFFHYKWNQSWLNRRKPEQNAASLRFTYHVSENLKHNIAPIKQEMCKTKSGEALFNEHYMGIPRKVGGLAIFGSDFDERAHVVPDNKILELLNPNEPVFLCVDPGYRMKAAVLGQLDPDHPRLLYIRAWTATDSTLSPFLDSVIMKTRRLLPGWDVFYMMDVAANQVNEQTDTTNAEVMAAKVGYMPVMQRQRREPGVSIMKSYMQRRDAFFISEHPDCKILVDAFNGGAVCEERNGIPTGAYAKDGYYEHACLKGSTLIWTTRGDIAIQDLTGDEQILTPAGASAIKWVGPTGQKKLIKWVTRQGSMIECTADHKVCVSKKGFVPLSIGDYIYRPKDTEDPTILVHATDELGEDNVRLLISSVVQSSDALHKEEVYFMSEIGVETVHNLSLERGHCYYANGILVSNCDAARYPAHYLTMGHTIDSNTNTGPGFYIAKSSYDIV